jgi:hypothetical protein
MMLPSSAARRIFDRLFNAFNAPSGLIDCIYGKEKNSSLCRMTHRQSIAL